MRVLLDENIPVRLKRELVGHRFASVNDADLGWKGIRNGVLLAKAEGRFDALLTADKNLYA